MSARRLLIVVSVDTDLISNLLGPAIDSRFILFMVRPEELLTILER